VSFKGWTRNNFFAGVLVVVPVLGTIALFSWLFDKVTGPGYAWLIGRFPADEETFLGQFLKGRSGQFLFRLAVLFLMFGLIVLIGALARNFLGRRVIRAGETFFEKIPIVNRVYVGLRQISQAFWGRNKTVFSHVVLLEYPRRGLYTLGFVTSPGRGEVDAKTEEKLINVFLPTTPNPTSGWFVMVPEDQTVTMEMKVEDALKMIISGGAVVPEYRKAVRVFEGRRGKKEIEQQGQTPPESEIATPQPG
jgi:uncharacterized membrane protein